MLYQVIIFSHYHNNNNILITIPSMKYVINKIDKSPISSLANGALKTWGFKNVVCFVISCHKGHAVRWFAHGLVL